MFARAMPIMYGAPPQIVAVPVPMEKRARPQQTQEQREEAAARTRAKQASVEAEIVTWYSDSITLAESLSTRFGNTPEHYVNMMFKSPDKLRAAARKPNPYNAFLHHLAKEAKSNDSDAAMMNAADLSRAHSEQYQALSTEQKAQFVQELCEERNSQQYGLRLTQRARTLDINRTGNLIEELISGLQSRVGIQAMYLIVRSNPELVLEPRWFFSDPALEEYLCGAVRRFDPERIGVLAEAFCVAGSDFFCKLSPFVGVSVLTLFSLLAQLRTNKEKVNWLKAEIRKTISQGLSKSRTVVTSRIAHSGDIAVDITGDDAAVMSYVQYTRDIQLKYGVSLLGWTHEKWSNPSELGNALEPLKTLYDALKDGSCHFKRLTASEKAVIQQEYDEDLQKGHASARKRRSDAGQKRKRARIETQDGESDHHGNK
ncbi:hypothetical protein ACG7TL_007120 [Trametes sanguinea]